MQTAVMDIWVLWVGAAIYGGRSWKGCHLVARLAFNRSVWEPDCRLLYVLCMCALKNKKNPHCAHNTLTNTHTHLLHLSSYSLPLQLIIITYRAINSGRGILLPRPQWSPPVETSGRWSECGVIVMLSDLVENGEVEDSSIDWVKYSIYYQQQSLHHRRCATRPGLMVVPMECRSMESTVCLSFMQATKQDGFVECIISITTLR